MIASRRCPSDDVGRVEEAVAVGPAMGDRGVHRRTAARIPAEASVEREDSADAAHEFRPGGRAHDTRQPSAQSKNGFEPPPGRVSELRPRARIMRQLQQCGREPRRVRAPESAGRTPASTTSGVPPTRVATTGSAAAIASRIVSETPSLIEQFTYTSHPPSHRRASSR